MNTPPANEIWFDIPEFPHHQISNLKRVRRLEHTILVERIVKGTIYPQLGRGQVMIFQSHPKKNFYRKVEVLYKKYVLQNFEQKTKKHRKELKIQF